MDVTISEDRSAHWIRQNHQNRIPKRWIAFDTESKSVRDGKESVQTWALGTAIRWRTDLKTGDAREDGIFDTPRALWEFVAEFCKAGTRTVMLAHNLSHDARISNMFEILPTFGYTLEWCNLDRNVSTVTWRSAKGTLVVTDLYTWLPVPLSHVGKALGIAKFDMPNGLDTKAKWERYCIRDTEIVYRAMSELVSYVRSEDLGNWQPTGAGMAYATWRHKFMSHKVLVHDDIQALHAERSAMHTGRAEAWRHGEVTGDLWTELDMTNAYPRIAAECDLPCKLKSKTGRLDVRQYRKIRGRYRVLAHVRVDTDSPCVPVHNGDRTIWPVGHFDTYLWDPEIDIALEENAKVTILESWLYTRQPILKEWAEWCLGILDKSNTAESEVIKLWIKHVSRALIGRLSLRTSSWDTFGANPDGITGITYITSPGMSHSRRMLHSGNTTLIETEQTEGRDSLPQITGYIMSECRARLWRAMKCAGFDNIAHVDTDSLITNRAGLAALQTKTAAHGWHNWHEKGSWRTLTIWGPRNYRRGGERKLAGVPTKATEEAPGVFTGESWHGLAHDLAVGRNASVTVVESVWRVARKDPRRADSPGVVGRTVALDYRSNDSTSSASAGAASEGA